jgi:hypothetical protein
MQQRITAGGPPRARRSVLARAARQAVFALDAVLRGRLAIFEYSAHAECMLRVAIVPAPADLALADGSAVVRGRPIADLHLWNEHVPAVPAGGADLAWLVHFDGRLRLSLCELAVYLRQHPGNDVHAVRMETAFGRPDADMDRIGRRFGFQIVRHRAPRTLGSRIHRFFADFLFLALSWAYNPGSLDGKRFRRDHHEYWMSRTTLDDRYGAPTQA